MFLVSFFVAVIIVVAVAVIVVVVVVVVFVFVVAAVAVMKYLIATTSIFCIKGLIKQYIPACIFSLLCRVVSPGIFIHECKSQ